MGRVERQRLIERCGFIKHATHIRHLGCVERRQRLIERDGIHKTWHAMFVTWDVSNVSG